MTAHTELKHMARKAKNLAVQMASAPTKKKNSVLEALMEQLEKHQKEIIDANTKDVSQAKSDGLNDALLERLSIKNKLEGIIHDIEQVIRLPDPIGEKFDGQKLPNQLQLTRYRTPIGVLGVIYESRPNVTIDISALTIKSGNCAILRGGSETQHTNQVLVELIQKSLATQNLPAEIIQLVTNPDRSQVSEMLKLHDSIDLIIPRGSATLQDFCRNNSTIPVITGGVGICHLFVDETADLERSLPVILNAKVQRPTVCNALDTLLVHAALAPLFIPKVIELLDKHHVTFRLDEAAMHLIKDNNPSCKLAGVNDWDMEWLSLVLGIKVVKDMQEAMDHIRTHGTAHSDGILTENKENADRFVKEVDSAAVYVNASTRFTDGGQFGLGSEVAVSTQKLHARGPMGLKELTTYKWVVRGDYQIRS